MGLNEEEPFYDYDTQLRLGGDFKDLLAGDFVDDRGIVVPKRELEYINHGVNSSVWKWKRESITRAVKSFFDGSYRMALRPEAARTIRHLDLVNLPNIHSTIKRKSRFGQSFDGYIMDYLPEDKSASFLDMPSEKLIQSFDGMNQDAKTLADAHILMNDVRMGNVMVTRSDIGDGCAHVFDMDLYRYEPNMDSSDIYYKNDQQLSSMCLQKLQSDILTDPFIDERLKWQAIDYLAKRFDIYQHPAWSTNYKVEDIFSSSDTPRQFIKK